MPSVNYAVTVEVDDRLSKFIKYSNKKKHTELASRTDGIDELLKRAGF